MTTTATRPPNGGPSHTQSPGRTRNFRLSSIDSKIWMAISGAGLLAFVTIHMLGNLQIYLGQDALNAYAYKLKSMPAVLWIARIGLLVTFALHLGFAATLRIRNRRARPQGYVVNDAVDTTLASRTMLTSGLAIFAFLIYHLLHFTLGVTHPDHSHLVDSQGRHDVYSMVVLGFQNIFVSATYILAMLFLGLHLSHAASSIFQTFGITTSNSRWGLHRAGLVLTVIVMLGNISIPVAVLAGLLGLPTEGVTPQ